MMLWPDRPATVRAGASLTDIPNSPAISGANASTGKTTGARPSCRSVRRPLSPHPVAADLQVGVTGRLLAEIAGDGFGVIHTDDRAARGARNEIASDHRRARPVDDR